RFVTQNPLQYGLYNSYSLAQHHQQAILNLAWGVTRGMSRSLKRLPRRKEWETMPTRQRADSVEWAMCSAIDKLDEFEKYETNILPLLERAVEENWSLPKIRT
ncbi:MAG: hypothetical protein AABZ06_11135, partial [Bdellovibrionota bacterium]